MHEADSVQSQGLLSRHKMNTDYSSNNKAKILIFFLFCSKNCWNNIVHEADKQKESILSLYFTFILTFMD